jgi:hypothetical protein
MGFTALAGWGGLGFVLLALVVNVCYLRAKLPIPGSGQSLAEVAEAFAAMGGALKRPSILAPASWLCTTVFAAGLLSVLPGAWGLVGFAGVLLQNATFAVVEALRFGVAAGGRESVAGLWGFSAVLFGFNQLFLATALLGFSVAGANAGLFAGWHAWLGYVSAALLFVSSSAAPYHVDGSNRLGPVGLAGWLGWIGWVVVTGVTLLAH